MISGGSRKPLKTPSLSHYKMVSHYNGKQIALIVLQGISDSYWCHKVKQQYQQDLPKLIAPLQLFGKVLHSLTLFPYNHLQGYILSTNITMIMSCRLHTCA